MAEALDMSLDDIIRNNKNSGGSNGNFRGRGRGRGFSSRSAPVNGPGPGPGPARRLPNRAPIRPAPYLSPEVARMQGLLAIAGTSSESGTKLYVSNLDYGVSNDDIKLLFSEAGELKRYSIHYDRSGRSKGTAEVVFARQSDAIAAMKRYNNVQLDGKPMKIEVVGVNLVTPAIVPPASNGILGHSPSTFRSGQGRIAGGGWDYGGGRGHGRGSGTARGRGRGRAQGEKVSAKDLDADLDKYHLEAMQIN